MTTKKVLPSIRLRSHMLAEIAENRLLPGQPCPTERELAHTLGMARSTVQSEMQALQREGLVERRGRRRYLANQTKIRTGGVGSLWPGTVAVIAPRVGSPLPQAPASGWWQFLLYGVQAGLQEAGLHVLLLNQERLLAGDLTRALRPPPQGLLVLEPTMIHRLSAQVVRAIQGRSLAAVVVGDEPDMAEFDRVVSDYSTGASMLVDRLVENGRRHIVQWFDTAPAAAWQLERQRGYATTLARHRIAARQPIVWDSASQSAYLSDDIDAQITAMGEQLKPLVRGRNPIDAIMATSDGQALMTNCALRNIGVTVGEDVVVTGYDAYWWQAPILARCPERPWATIDKNNFAIGEAAVRLLMERINGELPREPQRRLIAPTVIMEKP